MNPLRTTPKPHNTTPTTPQPQPQHATRPPLHPLHNTTVPCRITQHSRNPIPNHLDQPTQRTTPMQRQTTRQTTLWQFIQQHLNQHTQNNETQQRDTSQSGTVVSTDVESLPHTPLEQLTEPRAASTTHQQTMHQGNTRPVQNNSSQEHGTPQHAASPTPNLGWGDLTQFQNPPQHFWIISKKSAHSTRNHWTWSQSRPSCKLCKPACF